MLAPALDVAGGVLRPETEVVVPKLEMVGEQVMVMPRDPLKSLNLGDWMVTSVSLTADRDIEYMMDPGYGSAYVTPRPVRLQLEAIYVGRR